MAARPVPPPVPPPLANYTLCRMVAFFNIGRFGWTESYYIAASPTNNNTILPLLDQMAQQWAQTRRTILATNCVLEATRTEISLTSHRVSLNYAPAQGLGPGTGGGTTSDPSRGWLFGMYDVSEQVDDRRIFRGIPDNLNSAYNPALGPGATQLPLITTFKQAMQGILAAQYSSTNGSGKWIIASYDRTQSQYPVLSPSGVSAFAPLNTIQVIVTGVDTVTQPRDTVHLSFMRNRCIKGFSGRTTVLGVTPNSPVAGQTTYVTVKPFPSCNMGFAKLTGFVQTIYSAGWQYAFLEAERPVNKKLGRAFFGTAGRRSACSC